VSAVPGRSTLDGDPAVVVAVLGVRVVHVIADEIVDVVAVGNLLVTARGPVLMRRIVCAAGVLGGAAGGIGVGDVEDVLIDVIAVRVVQMAVVQVVGVAVVLDRLVAAAGTVLVGVVGVDGVLGLGHDRHHRRVTAASQADGDEKHPHVT
jgi:hypothetical protein